jgi:predicted Zn-ribbon and HTH transcriptional regulator
VSSYLRTYLNSGLSDIFVIESKEWEETSGYQMEHETEIVVARKGDGFVKVKLHERKSFAPGSAGLDVGIESEEIITEDQYFDLVSNAPSITNLDTEGAVAVVQKQIEAEKKKLEKFNAKTAERTRITKELEKITPRCKNCGHEMRVTRKNGREFWACPRFPKHCEIGGLDSITAAQSKLMADLEKLGY